jgi:hypothetical protein
VADYEEIRNERINVVLVYVQKKKIADFVVLEKQGNKAVDFCISLQNMKHTPKQAAELVFLEILKPCINRTSLVYT